MSLLGRVIRAGIRDAKDPMYQVTLEDPPLKPKTTAYRRVGLPRSKWHTDTMQEAWGRTAHYAENGQPEYKGTEQQRLTLKAIAGTRLKPFEPTKNERAKMNAHKKSYNSTSNSN